MTAASGSDDQMRVGNPERERAIGLLNNALTEGYLDIHEFDERAAVVYAARTRGELREVLVHLPGDDRLFPNLASPVGPGSPVDSPSFVEFDINWKTVTRKGSWQVPARILVAGSMGTANLDLSGAHFAQSDVAIEVQISASSVKVLLGSDQSVVTHDLVFTSWSSIRNRAGPPAIRTGPVVRLHGALSGWSSVMIRRS